MRTILSTGRIAVRKRYYIFIVSHDWDGQLRRIPIPVQWVVLFVVFALVGASTLLGLAGSYTRMLTKVQRFNELRARQEVLVKQLTSARNDVQQSRAEVASLGTLATEVSALYNLKHTKTLQDRLRDVSGDDTGDLYDNSLNNFHVLETTALNSSVIDRWSNNISGLWRPDIWPVRGRITSSFGERLDPFQGEGAFHAGIDIGVPYGTHVHATAEGVVVYASWMDGYGRTVIINHGHGMRTLYAHMSSLAVTVGQHVDRDDVIGFVGDSGRSTGPHLHYEVRINNNPVNPYKYL